MATEEDKKFDAVLGGFLASDLRARSERLHCPEPDVLAAYHERSLFPEEMNSWKEHIVGCAHCQAILSDLEVTDSIPLQAVEKEEVLVMQPAAMPAAAAGQNAARAASPEKLRLARVSRGVRWKWLAPAGALAAGLLVWVAWHEKQQPNLSGAEGKIAKVEPSSVPPLSSDTRQSSARASSDEVASLSKDSSALGGPVLEEKARASKNLKQLDQLGSRVPSATPKIAMAKPPADKEKGARADTGRERADGDSLTTANRVENQLAVEAKTGVAGAAAETAEAQTQTANNALPNQLQNQNQSNTQRVHGPSAANQAQPIKKERSTAYLYKAAPAPPPKSEAAPALNEVAATRSLIAGSLDWRLISAPGKKTLWRAGPAGLIVFSNDGGATWVRQKSDVQVELISGSAPSDKVCWIVGRAGTILLTIDSGTLWSIIHSPLDEDLAGVRAQDAFHATVWTSGNTKVFETSDGGVTWNPVAP